jgi:hypothetical protein
VSFCPKYATKEWHYMMENINPERNLHLLRLDEMNRTELRISLHDHETKMWTKWEGLFHCKTNDTKTAYDIHREILENEIVIESDYPTFEENYESSRLIGAILEDKGFRPMYYYSGSKSIHVHVLIDFKCLLEIDLNLQDLIRKSYTKNRFIKEFMLYLRKKASTFWNTNARVSDEQISNATKHLIRCELSLNKLGFKTFMGYTYKDLTWIPPLHNFNTKTLPRIGKIILSRPKDIQNIVEDFLVQQEINVQIKKKTNKIRSLSNWIEGTPNDHTDLRKCVKFILKADKRLQTDGFNRGFFILFNELRKVYDPDKAKALIEDWNSQLGFPIRQQDIDYRGNSQPYSLSCEYIHDYLKSCSFTDEEIGH